MAYHMILLVITFNDILLSPLMVLIYHFVFDGSSFQYTKLHPFIVQKHTIYYYTC